MVMDRLHYYRKGEIKMLKKWSKKIYTSLLTFAMIIGMVGVMPVYAAEPVVDLGKKGSK